MRSLKDLARRALPLLAAALAAGCATTAGPARFDAFAAAGTQYAQAVDTVLANVGQLTVNGNSQKLLDSRELAPVSRQSFKEQDETIRGYLTEIDLLRRQVQVLSRYFQALSSLAGSDAPQAFTKELEATATSLDGLSAALGKTAPVTAKQGQAAAGLGGLVVRGVQDRQLRAELEKRKGTIAEVLSLEEALLAELRDQTAATLQFTTNREYEETVLGPYLDPAKLTTPADVDTWTTQRAKLLGTPTPVQWIDDATAAAQALRQAWLKLLSNQLTPADVQAVTSELQAILAATAL